MVVNFNRCGYVAEDSGQVYEVFEMKKLITALIFCLIAPFVILVVFLKAGRELYYTIYEMTGW